MTSAASHKIDDYETLLVALQNVLGVVVPEEQRSCLVERIEPLLSTYQFDSLASLADGMTGGRSDERTSSILTSVLDVISQRETSWNLGPELCKLLQDYIFSQLPDKAKIWVVSCGEGQLAYSVAMEALEYENRSGDVKNFQIIATDISEKSIAHAKTATYSALQLSGLRDNYRKLYTSFNSEENSGQIKDKVRQLVSFSQCDLKDNFQFLGEMDLIICPEVLVYYSNGVKASILQRFSELLKSGGIFVTGSNQGVVAFNDRLERVEHPAGVFYRQKK